MYLYVMNKARIKCFLEYCLIAIFAILLCVYLIDCTAAEGNAFRRLGLCVCVHQKL